MNRALLIVMAVALLLIGPVMFLFARGHALDGALAGVRPGETPAQVLAALGPPQERVRLAPAAKAGIEYRYHVWPLPGAWVVDFNDGRVVRTARR